MSRGRTAGARREALLRGLSEAGRELSDAIVLFHTAVAGELGLGASDWKALGLLERHGPLTAGDLSARSGLAPASVTGIIDRLELGGWVSRGRDPEDGRRVIVSLNPVDTVKLGPLFAGLMRRLAELYERYTDAELEFLLEFMKELAERQQAASAELTSG